jgi:hypothetical protein
MLPHPLEQRIADTRRQARRLSLLYGLSWVAGALLATVLALGLADYLIHFHDPGIRLLATLAVLLVAAWVSYRYLYPAVVRRLRDVEIAQKIERRFPILGDRLSSAVEFLKQSENDVQAGSAALRRAVIVETTAAVERLNIAEALERRPARRALGAAGAIFCLALLAIACDPLSARLALARLIKPLGGDAWPRKHDLAFVRPPSRIASGQTFEVELQDRNGAPPDEVRIHYLYDNDGHPTEEVEAMHLLDGVLVARKENVARPFQYRAEGGDDQSMPWQPLEVVEPPRIESLQATLYPPAYTGWPPEPAENNLHALRGTRVGFAGSTTKPLVAAALRVSDGPTIACVVGAEGYSFELKADAAEPLVIDKSGTYWFELQDPEGLLGGQENIWEIRAVPDQPPSVSIEQPGANLFITPTAVVPLRIMAKDDQAVHDVSLHFGRSGTADTADTVIPLYTGPARVEPSAGGLAGGVAGESRLVEHSWDISSLDLKPGSQVTFFAAAADYLPQTGRSTDRRLVVISPQELADRLAQRQSLILGELRRALRMQQDARAQTSSLEIQMREVGRLSKQDVDHAQGTELSQRQVTRTLTSQTEGVPAQIKDMLTDLASNRIDNADVSRRMQDILGEIGRLESDHLAPIERELTSAIKGAQVDLADSIASGQPDRPQSPAVGAALADAGSHQDKVIASLEGMLANLSEWDNYRRFGRDVAQVEREQEEVERSTAQIGSKTLGKDLKDLEPQQQAELKKLSSRQSELGRRFDKLLQQMDEVRGRLDQNDPLASATLDDALHLARQQGTSGKMRSAGEQVQHNQLGQASAAQQQARKELDEMLDILANRREQELGRLVKKLRESEQELAALRERHEGLQKKRAQANAGEPGVARTEAQKRELERLNREQRKLQEDLARLARKLERLQAEQAGKTAGSASGKVGREAAAGEQGDAAGAKQQSELADLDLERTQQQLAERRKEVEVDLARARLARLQDALKSLHVRQQQVVAETDRLEAFRTAERQLSRAQTASVHSLAREQQLLESETRGQAAKLAGAEVVRLALESAARDMARAAAQLARSETGASAQQAEQDALARLAALIEALKPSEQAGGAKKPGDGAGGGGKQGGSSDAVKMISELKLLKLMQEDVNRRFQQLRDVADDEERAQRLADLGEEQGRLAEVALRMSQPLETNPEDDPDHLPDLRKQSDRPASIEDPLLPPDGGD